jgi:uncharacterized protein (TIGR04141 family)
MPRTPSPAARTSLYRVRDVPDLADAVQDKYLLRDTFETYEHQVGGRDALLVTGLVVTDKVTWADHIYDLVGQTLPLGNQTAIGVLLIRSNDDGAWALCYGLGFQTLDQSKVDPGFGQRIAIRAANPSELNSLTRTTLDQRSKTDRFSIPSGDHLRGFGVGGFGEIVTRLVGRATIDGLTAGNTPVRIRGADALSIPLGRKPDALVADLDVLNDLLDEDPAPDLAILEQLVPVKAPTVIETLESALEDELDAEHGSLALSWPHERIEENTAPASWRFWGAGRHAPQDNIPELDDILDEMRKRPAGQRVERASTLKVQLFRDGDGEDAMSTAIPVIKWLAFEHDLDGRRYCLHDGVWYLMTYDYAANLKEHTQKLFDRGPGVELPAWPIGQSEDEYNQAAAAVLGGVCLDKKLLYTSLHRRGIEACDVLTADGTFIHVKQMDGSAPASHQIAQALVSADALMYDSEARVKLAEKVEANGGDPALIPDRVERVVLAMARKDAPLTADNLFTFTQVTLMRGVQMLQVRGVDVFVAPIERSTEPI